LYDLPFFALQYMIILLTTFSNFLDSWLILVFIYEKTTQLKMFKYNEKWKYSWKYKCKLCSFFFTCVTFYIVNVFVLIQIIFTEFWKVFCFCSNLNTSQTVQWSDEYIKLFIVLFPEIVWWYFPVIIWNQDNNWVARAVVCRLCKRKHEPHLKRMKNSGFPEG
jgi:hypothetical protein